MILEHITDIVQNSVNAAPSVQALSALSLIYPRHETHCWKNITSHAVAIRLKLSIVRKQFAY